MNSRIRIVAAFVLAFGFAMHAAVACADSFKSGDAVEVFFLNKWWPGTVVKSTARGMVLVSFEFAGTKENRAFPRTAVRLAFESGAMSRARFWTDSSGKSLGRAVVVSVDDKEVTLRKPNMDESAVPIDKLSKSDQSFLKQLKKESEAEAAKNPRPNKKKRGLSSPEPASMKALPSLKAPEPPRVEEFASIDGPASRSDPMSELRGLIGEKDSSSLKERPALTPDPAPKYFKLQEGGVSFPQVNFFERLGAIVPFGGKDSWVLVAVEDSISKDTAPTRVLWASLAQRKIAGQQALPPAEVVLDYLPPARRLLTYTAAKGLGGKDEFHDTVVLTLWEVVPTDKQVKPIVRWNSRAAVPSGCAIWARLANGDVVIQQTGEHHECEVVAWDAAAKKAIYRTKQASFGGKPALSGGGKHLFIPEIHRVRVLEAATGQEILTLPAKQARAVAVSSDGRRAAVLESNALTVWNLADPKVKPMRCQAEGIGSPFEAKLNWAGEDRLLISDFADNLVLYSLPHQAAIWSYNFETDSQANPRERRVREIAAGHVVYSASSRMGATGVMTVGAVALPGPKVDETAATLDRDSLMILKPGMAVRLDARAGANNERVQAAMQRKIEANGWKVDPAASIAIVGEMTRDSKQVTYRFPGRAGGDQTATITSEISSVWIEIGGKRVWFNSTGEDMAPGVVMLKEGQSAQDAVNQHARKPDVEFFDRVEIPDRILDPEKKTGVGTTKITSRGLIPQ